MREERGDAVTVVDLYELVARSRGLRAEDLDAGERTALAHRAILFVDPTWEIIPGSGRPEADPIELVPYDEDWPRQFEEWEAKLLAALPRPPRRIDHIGSTAVPGLAAKPVVDIQVSVDDPEDEAAYVPAIESLGVQLRNRDSEHRYFRPFSGLERGVHIHVCAAGSEWERRHVAFRDYLRRNPEARSAYLEAKQDAARRWRDDRIAYTEAKGAVIRQLTDEATRAQPPPSRFS